VVEISLGFVAGAHAAKENLPIAAHQIKRGDARHAVLLARDAGRGAIWWNAVSGRVSSAPGHLRQGLKATPGIFRPS
jgi:hypothetical protein